MVSRKTKAELAGWLDIAIATLTPFGAWAIGESTIRAAMMMGVISGMVAARRWFTENPYERPRAPKKIEAP